ncbi:MAG TPA: hypothetical protein PKW18_13025 [Candidatus Sumerlaeota bacterium]|nr:hypothetical protein [Candidatus Sumerlaeota bacterium]
MKIKINGSNGAESLKLKKDKDGRWRWFSAAGVDTEVSGKTKAEAIASAEIAWHGRIID